MQAIASIKGASNGHLGIFQRENKKDRSVDELMGRAVPQMLEYETVSNAVGAVGAEAFNQRLDHAVFGVAALWIRPGAVVELVRAAGRASPAPTQGGAFGGFTGRVEKEKLL